MQNNHPKNQNISKIILRLTWYPILVAVSTIVTFLFPVVLCSSQDCSTPEAMGLGYLVIVVLVLYASLHFIAFPLGIYSMFKSASILSKQCLLPRHKQKKIGITLSLAPIALLVMSAITNDILKPSPDSAASTYILFISFIEMLLFIPFTGSGIILLRALRKWPN